MSRSTAEVANSGPVRRPETEAINMICLILLFIVIFLNLQINIFLKV